MAQHPRRDPVRLVPLEGALDAAAFGGRGAALAGVRARGLSVLESWCVPVAVFRDAVHELLPPGHDPASLLRVIHRPAGLERAAHARERILLVSVPALREELERVVAEVVEARPGSRFAVRASPTVSDDLARGAGLELTRQGLRTADELDRALHDAWAGALGASALAYLRGRRVRDLAMGVVIQRLPALAASGVLLARDPDQPRGVMVETPTPSSPVAVAVPVRVLALTPSAPAAPLGRRARGAVVRFTADGVVTEQVAADPPDLAERAAAVTGAVGALAELAAALEHVEPGALELELAISPASEVFVAEARRVAGQDFPSGGNSSTEWSRLGLGESLFGPPTPLTWSLVEAFTTRELDPTLRSLGAKRSRGAPLVGRVRGRFYFELTELERALAAVPGVGRRTLRELAGSLEPAARSPDVSLAEVSLAAARVLARERRLADEVRRFEHDAEQQRRWLVEMDLAILPDDGLETTLRESRGFFERTARAMIDATLALVATHTALTRVLERSAPIEAPRLVQAITAGVGDLETALPGVALAHVAAIAARDPGARSALLAGAEAPAALPVGPARRALEQFLDAYGDRALEESELARPRFAEAPAPLLAMVTALMSDPRDAELRLVEARRAAARELARVETRLPYVEQALVRALVSRWRRLARMRERVRVWMARTLGMLRTVALDLDRRMRRLDPSLTPGSAFFSTLDELVSASRAARSDLGPIIRMRRAEHGRDAALSEPPETFQGAPLPFELPPPGSRVLHGVPGSGGKSTGRARLVGPSGAGAARLEPGDVLVLRAPDVAFAPLFLAAGALVSELGGPLCHGAVVAREYGLPAVLGLRGAAGVIVDGEALVVDGDRGVVERLAR
ncbi:MAG: PEP-utilizing enzyme [Sorangiineae bacterium]|nr:PEP-utilizing enzyme [Polyangiaceae bacterium]MEB2322305.1 PEP-utilizing enzyme [Sorangiineae bacterium]